MSDTNQQDKEQENIVQESIGEKNNKKSEEENYEDFLLKQLEEKGVENEFIELVKTAMAIARKKKNWNKRWNFGIQLGVIILTAITTFVTGGITGEGCYKVIAAITSAAATALLAIYNLYQYKETWLRHSNRYSKLVDETTRFINLIGSYGDDTDKAKKLYKDSIVNILSANSEQFNKNMRCK